MVTTVEGSSFCVCAPNGDLGGTGAVGVFFRDTRILWTCDLTVDGSPPEPLAVMTPEPYRAVFLGRLVRGSRRSDSNLLVERVRRIGDGAREDLTLRNFGPEEVHCRVTLSVEADFADLFEVKAGDVRPAGDRRAYVEDGRLVLEQQGRRGRRATVVQPQEGAVIEPGDAAGQVHFDVVLAPRGVWSTAVLVVPALGGHEVAPAFPFGQAAEESPPAVRRRTWNEGAAVVTTPHHGLQTALRRSRRGPGRAADLRRRATPTRRSVAAGAPWFMALFGRDSLLTA